MHKLVLIRHGESTWNQENRFTDGRMWDSPTRVFEEAHQGGRILAKGRVRFRHRLHVRAQEGHQDPVGRTRGNGPHVIPFTTAGGSTKGITVRFRDSTRSRRPRSTARSRSTSGAAATTPAPRHWTPDDPRYNGNRPPLQGAFTWRDTPHGVPQGHGGALPPVLARDDRPTVRWESVSSSQPRATASGRWSSSSTTSPKARL